MFAYCLNNPINYSDFGGVRAEEATPNSKDDEQENKTVVVYYESCDEAVRAFGRKYHAKSVSAKLEYGIEIYSTIRDGEVYYYFNEDELCIGTQTL